MKQTKSLFIIILGNLLLSCGVSLFLLPCGFVSGGVTGMAIVIHHYSGLPISVSVLAFNVVFFLLGLALLGKRFAVTTLLSTFLYPFFLELIGRIPADPSIAKDTLMSAIYAGLLTGMGLGLVFKEGASTGGTDIPALLIHKKAGLSLEACIYITDGLIILSQAPFANPQEILYGLLIMLLCSFVIGRIELSGTSQIQLFIISPKYREIQDAMLHSLDTGVTMVHIETGLRGTPSQAVLSVIPKRKLNETTHLIQKTDPTAFITIHEIREVRGRGFSLKREYLKQ